jgi:hypothetical protein
MFNNVHFTYHLSRTYFVSQLHIFYYFYFSHFLLQKIWRGSYFPEMSDYQNESEIENRCGQPYKKYVKPSLHVRFPSAI